MKSEPGVGIL